MCEAFSVLTADLLRIAFSASRVQPRYIDVSARRYHLLAAKVIALFESHRGSSRGMLISALAKLEEGRVQYKVLRGLVKLLLDEYCTFVEHQSDDREGVVSPSELRKTVFGLSRQVHPIVSELSVTYWGDRQEVLAKAAACYGLSVAEVEVLLYADLPNSQVLACFHDPGIDGLLNRYNVALVQALITRANCLSLRVGLNAGYGRLFHYIKLCRLIHQVQSTQDGYQIWLDGPVNLFRQSRKYGVRMATFVPGLLLCRSWDLSADIRLPDGRRGEFSLTSESGLPSHYQANKYDSALESDFARSYAKQKTEWTLYREADFVDLGEEVFVPDFVLRHPDGRSVLLEIVGFWRSEYLRRKLHKLRRAQGKAIVVAVSRKLNVGEDDLVELSAMVVWFGRKISAKDVIEAAERASPQYL